MYVGKLHLVPWSTTRRVALLSAQIRARPQMDIGRLDAHIPEQLIHVYYRQRR